MFGKKKEITQKFIGKTEEELEDFSQNEQKKEKIKGINPRESDNNFIFYGSDNKFTKQLEIYATLKGTKDLNEIQNPKNKKLVLIIVDSNCPMELLSYKICESFGQFKEYKDLEGLTATNLTKNEEENKTLPSEGKVGDVLRNGDIIYLDLISNEVWIKTNISMINIINRNSKINVTMDIKVKREMSFKLLKFKLLKSSIICYLDKVNKSENNFHYIVSEFSISTSAHGKLDRNKLLIFDDMKIGQLFGFKNNMKIQIKFYPIEFVLFQKLKAIPIPRPKLEKIVRRKIFEKFKKYKKSRFRDLLKNPKFTKEKEYIFNYIKNLFKYKNRDKLSKCYVYSINDDVNINVEEDADETKFENLFDNEKEISNLNIEAEGGGDTIDIESELKKSKSSLNKSQRSKMSASTNNSFREENKENKPKEKRITLIVVPPINEDEEIIESNRISISNKKYSTKQFAFPKFSFNKNTDDEEEEENEDEDEKEKEDNYNIQIERSKKRKNSLFTKLISKKKTFGALDFEIIDKKDIIKNNDEMIIYKDLKPKEIIKKPLAVNANKINLCKDFDQYFEKAKFIDFLSGLYLMNIQKGTLEKCTIPKFRSFKIVEKKNLSFNAKKKRKKRVNSYTTTFLNQIFPVKRINLEIGIVIIFISLMLMYLSSLIFESYYGL